MFVNFDFSGLDTNRFFDALLILLALVVQNLKMAVNMCKSQEFS
jgi:hypothetical protein